MSSRLPRLAPLLALLLLAAACNRSGNSKEKKAPLPDKAPPAASKDKPDEPQPRKPGPSPKALASALVTAWVKAQNSGSYSDYEKLYAKKFFGVKLSKGRRKNFDRGAWLQDRKNMFRRPFTVKAMDVGVTGTMQAASVTFEQSWASSTYSDIGAKRLLLVNKGTAKQPLLRIAQEEMLTSEDAKQEALESVPSPLEFSQVRSYAGGLTLVLKRDFNMNQVNGPLEALGKHEARYVVHRPLLNKSIKGVDGDIVGRTFSLYGASGKLCEARVKRLSARASLTPHFGQVQIFEGENPGEKKLPEAMVALIIWEQAGGRGFFTAAALETNASCTGAIWARATSLPAPTIYKIGSGDEAADRLKAARSSRPGEIAFKKAEGMRGDATKRSEIIQSIEHPTNGTRYLHYVAYALDCHEYIGSYWELFQDREDRPVALTQIDANGALGDGLYPFRVLAAFDLENDGKLELVGGDELIRWSRGGYFPMRGINPPFLDCPC